MLPFAFLLLMTQAIAPAQSKSSAVGTHANRPAVAKKQEAGKLQVKGRILGIGGIFFKSGDPAKVRDWYGKHLGLMDSGHGAMLPWRDRDDPHTERMTIWSVFPSTTKYFDASKASFMMNYVVDDLDTLLERLKQEGVKIDPKRQNEAYGRFAWIYDPDGNKIELWQPLAGK